MAGKDGHHVSLNSGVTRNSQVLSMSSVFVSCLFLPRALAQSHSWPADLSRVGSQWPGHMDFLVGQAWIHLHFLTFVLCGVHHL